jgi:hypothetical protein
MYRHYGHLSGLATFSFCSITLCVLFVLFAGPAVGHNKGNLEVFLPLGLVTKLGSVVFALTYASSSFMGYASLENRSLELYDRISGHAVATGGLLCIIVGMAGYGSFRDDTEGEILDNFTTHAGDPFKVMLVLHLILYVPIDCVVMRDACVKLFVTKDTSKDLTFGPHFALTFFLVGFCTMVVLIIRDAGLTKGETFSAVLDFTGAISGSMLSFVFPALMFLRVKVLLETLSYFTTPDTLVDTLSVTSSLSHAHSLSSHSNSLLVCFCVSLQDPTWPRREALFQEGTHKATALLVFGVLVIIVVPAVIFSQL